MNPSLKKWLGRISFYGLLIAATLALVWTYMNFVHWPKLYAITFTDHEFWSHLTWVPGLDTAKYTTNPPVQYELSNFEWLALLCALPLLALIDRFSLTDLPAGQRAFNIIMRALVLIALVGSLLNLQRADFDSARTSTVFIVDVSESIPDDVLEKTRDYLQSIYDQRTPNDTARIITFSQRPRPLRIGADGKIPPLARHSDNLSPTTPKQKNKLDQTNQHTNIQAALQLAYSQFPPDTLRRAILITDGNQTEGDLLAEAFNARAYGIKLYTHHFDIKPKSEVMIRSVTIPDRDALRVDQPFRVEIELYSTLSDPTEITLSSRLGTKYDPQKQTLSLNRGENYAQFEFFPDTPGTLPYTIDLTRQGCDESKAVNSQFVEPTCTDFFVANNHYQEKLNITDKPHILYSVGDSRGADYLRRALEGDNKDTAKFKIDMKGLPDSADGYEQYDLVIMADLPMYDAKTQRTLVTFAQMGALENYVRSGGGFVAIGGEQSFGLGGYQDTAIERILPIQFKADLDDPKNTSALALVIDRSASMKGRKLEVAKEAAKKAVEALKRNDRITVIAFNQEPTPVVSLQTALNRLQINNKINGITAIGETDIEAGLFAAYDALALASARIKHVILLTDGKSSYGTIASLVKQMRSERITVSTVGIGSDIDRVLLRQIADLGGGRSYFTTDYDAIPRIFLDETNTVTRNAIIEEPFKPQVVKNHAMIKGLNISSAPDLLGFVASKAKSGAEVILRDPNKKAPILATWRIGSGRATAFTSDAKNRWASGWVVSSELFTKFWTQIVRETMRRRDGETFFDMESQVRDGRGVVSIDAIDDNDQFINELTVYSRIVPPQTAECKTSAECVESYGENWYCCTDFASTSKERPTQVGWDCGEKSLAANQCFSEATLQQIAPGRYEAEFPLDEFGSYSLEASLYKRDAEGKLSSLAKSRGTLTYPFPAEYFFLDPNRVVVERAIEMTGGKIDPKPEEIFDNEGKETKRKEPLWMYFLFTAAFLMVLDVLFRRVRFWGKTSVPWSAVTGRGQ
jgi:Ca-activated chloride channel family protein